MARSMKLHIITASQARRSSAHAGHDADKMIRMTTQSKPAIRKGAAKKFVDGYLAYLLARASFLISSEFHDLLSRQGIAVMHWRILAILDDGPLSVKDLARTTLRKQPMVSRNVDRLVQLALLRREVDVGDRRSIKVSLTPSGARLARKLKHLAKEHEASVLAPLGASHARALIADLTRLIELHA